MLAGCALGTSDPAPIAVPQEERLPQRISCDEPTLALLAPLTGDGAAIGREQLQWATYAVERHEESSDREFALIERDTRLIPAVARTEAQKLARADGVLGVVGPASSDEVVAAGRVAGDADLALVSPSATRPALTNGRFPTFFRVVPPHGRQAQRLAEAVADRLEAQHATLLEDESEVSRALGSLVARRLDAKGVEVRRLPASPLDTPVETIAAQIDEETDALVLLWQSAADGERLALHLRDRGRALPIVGADTQFSSDFRANGSFVVAFGPTLDSLPLSDAFARAFRRRYGDSHTAYGPTAYEATSVLLQAIERACRDGRSSRREVLRVLRSAEFDAWGEHLERGADVTAITFTARGESEAARYSLFRLREGIPSPVATPPTTTSSETETTTQAAETTVTQPPVVRLVAARGDVWLSVREEGADGDVLFEGLLPAGESRTVRHERVHVVAGAPAALDVQVDGRPAAIPPDSATIVVTRAGVSAAGG